MSFRHCRGQPLAATTLSSPLSLSIRDIIHLFDKDLSRSASLLVLDLSKVLLEWALLSNSSNNNLKAPASRLHLLANPLIKVSGWGEVPTAHKKYQNASFRISPRIKGLYPHKTNIPFIFSSISSHPP